MVPFNIDLVNYNHGDIVSPCYNANILQKFFNTMFTCSCLPFIKIPDRVTGRSKTLIDKDINSGEQISFKAPDFSCAQFYLRARSGTQKK